MYLTTTGSWLPRTTGPLDTSSRSLAAYSLQLQADQNESRLSNTDVDNVEYLITVSTNDSVLSYQKTWRVARTYAQFHELHRNLIKLLRGKYPPSVPPFPSPSDDLILFLRTFCMCLLNRPNSCIYRMLEKNKENTCNELRIKLETWLKEISLSVNIITCQKSRDKFYDFLEVLSNILS